MSEAVEKDLPNNWRWENLKSLGEWSGGGTPSKSNPNFWSQRDIPWVSPKDMKVKNIDSSQDYISKTALEKTNLRLLPERSLLMVTRSGILAHSFPVAINDVPVTVNQDLKALVLSKELNDKYVYYALKRYERAILKECSKHGTTVHSIEMPKLMRFQLPIAPPEQQKRIVAKIEELFSHIDAGIEALKKAKQLLKQYRQSVLKAAVTGELTKEWREANKAKLEPASQLLERILKERRQKWEEQQLEQFKAKGKMPKDEKWKANYKELAPVSSDELKVLPVLPDGWIYTRLGNVIDEPKYGTSKKCTYDSKGTGVLRIPNVANGVIDSEDLKFAKFDDSEIETYELKEGDILTIRSNGSISLVGKCALIGEKDTKYLYAGYLIRLRPNSRLVESLYVINVLNTILLRNQIESKAKSTSGVNNINSGELQSLIIPVCIKSEQAEISVLVDEKLAAADRLLSEIELQLTKSEKNKQSILASAFSGVLSYE